MENSSKPKKITIDVLAGMMKNSFDHLAGEIKEVREEMREGFKKVDERFEQVDKRFNEMDRRFDTLEKISGSHENRISHLEDDVRVVKTTLNK